LNVGRLKTKRLALAIGEHNGKIQMMSGESGTRRALIYQDEQYARAKRDFRPVDNGHLEIFDNGEWVSSLVDNCRYVRGHSGCPPPTPGNP
jgi:hypothetical protein